ncbi:hypothetical protein SBH57_002067 [Pseudomonas aeruginosa]|nr:hypothetical protein [Pseudomonas aeruginosa]ELH1108358.1 hypothetical protein [Pseudomonas aeruginosa]ELU0705875.1 hypothetical protein [Pseudomonas aeruginosa]
MVGSDEPRPRMDYFMCSLPTAALDSFRHIRPPDTWQEMQNFCLDAFPLVQKKFSTGRPRTANYWASSGYGKNGDSQNGVDIFDHFSTTTMQCKRVEKFDVPLLRKELDTLRGYRSPLNTHFIVTSLEETNRAVTEHVRKLNDTLECDPVSGQVLPMLPAARLPKLYVLNWPEIKAILSTDLFLAMKWRFYPNHTDYPNLNGVNLAHLIAAAGSMGCSIPPGGGGKSDRVMAAIDAMTQSLNADAIASLGEAEIVASSTIDGLHSFMKIIDETWEKGRRVKPAIAYCESLDGVRKGQGLRALDGIVPFWARIEAFKYLNRLAEMVGRLVHLLDDENYFAFGHGEIEHQGMLIPVEDERIRHYNFSDAYMETPPWYISREQVMRDAQLIAREVRKVRMNIPPAK